MNLLLFLLIAIPVVLLLYVLYMFFIRIYIYAARFKKMDPTLKVFMTPFTGLLGVQKNNIQKYGDSHHFAKAIVQQNPQQHGYLTNIGYKPFLIVCSAKIVKEILINPHNFKKFNVFKHSYKTYQKGIFLSQGDDWAQKRVIIGPSFNNNSLKKMIPIMHDSIHKFLQRIKKQVLESPKKVRQFGVVHENQLMIGEILIRIFFSEEALNKIVKGKKLSIAIADYTAEMYNRSRTGLNIFMQLFFKESVIKMNFTKQDKELQSLVDEINVILYEIIEKRLKQPTGEKDFIEEYIVQMKQINAKIQQAQRQGKPHKYKRITKQQIAQQLFSFYFAGIDTTGHLISMALYALAEYTECREKIIAQLKQHIKCQEDLTYQNLQKLDYMGKFLDQCLRMWPPAAGMLPRVAQQDLNLGPYQIPKGMLIGANIIGLMHNPNYYIEPQIFNPGRWYDKILYNKEPYSFIPFSAGQRSCIGKYLALAESKLIIISFLTNFNIQRTEVPLRMHAKFLYEPIDENLIKLTIGGIKLGQ